MYRKLLVASLFLASCEKEVIEPAKYYKELVKYSKTDERTNKKRTKKRKRKHDEKINKDANAINIRLSMHSGRRNFGSDTIIFRQPNKVVNK